MILTNFKQSATWRVERAAPVLVQVLTNFLPSTTWPVAGCRPGHDVEGSAPALTNPYTFQTISHLDSSEAKR